MTVDTGLVVMFSFLDLRIPRNGPYALSYASDEQMSPPSLVCKQNSSHLHSLWVGRGKQFKKQNFATFPHLTIRFRKSEIQVLSLSSKYSQLIMNAKTNLMYFLKIGPLQLAIHVVQNSCTKPLCWGVREGRSGTRQTNSSLH